MDYLAQRILRIDKMKLIIIDGNSLLFRAYFAMRPMQTKDGFSTQGIYAFVNMLNKIIKEQRPTHLCVAFDVKKKTFRHEIYDDYKAGRKATPIDLINQIPVLKDILNAMNIPIFEKERFEADDIIGTISKDSSELNIETLIITGDKDELQLIDENVHVMINKKGVSEFVIYDEEKMNEIYGISPKAFIDLKGLMGDKSDNIPGITGIGEKKGLQLLNQYGSLENIIEHKDEIKGKTGENVRNDAEKAIMSKELATINRDVPIEYEFDNLELREANIENLIEIYKRLEFNSFLNKISDIEKEDISKLHVDDIKIIGLDDFLKKLKPKDDIYIKFLKNSGSNLDKIALFNEKNRELAKKEVNIAEEKEIFNKILQSGYLLSIERSHDFIKRAIELDINPENPDCDMEIGEYLLNPSRKNYDLSKLFLEYFNMKVDVNEGDFEDENLKIYFECLKLLKTEILKELKNQELFSLFKKCEIPIIAPMASMEVSGMNISKKTLSEIGEHLDIKIQNLSDRIIEISGVSFNINSPKQLGKVLFEDLNLPYHKKKVNNKNYQTSAEVLEKLKGDYEIAGLVLEYRKYTKLKSTYITGILEQLGDESIIHPTFNQTVTTTGRISCTKPNLQNIPIRDEYGRNIRKAFIPRKEDYIFTSADYSQIELRVMAALSKDESFIDAFNNDYDIHKSTASKVFGIPIDDVTNEDRSRAKAINFGIIYGMSSFGLSEELNISINDAENYIKEYFKKHKAVKEFLDTQIEFAKNNGFVKTILGRIRYIPEINSKRFYDRELGKRLAMNTPIQGSAADIIKLAMAEVYYKLKERNLDSKLILQIHDELIIEGPSKEVDEVKELLRDIMENVVDIGVKLKVDVSTGKNWYELK